MMVGGNQRGRQFFKQHGWYELGADKIEAKVGFPAWTLLLLLSRPRPSPCSHTLRNRAADATL